MVKELVASALTKDVDNVEVDVSLGGGRGTTRATLKSECLLDPVSVGLVRCSHVRGRGAPPRLGASDTCEQS